MFIRTTAWRWPPITPARKRWTEYKGAPPLRGNPELRESSGPALPMAKRDGSREERGAAGSGTPPAAEASSARRRKASEAGAVDRSKWQTGSQNRAGIIQEFAGRFCAAGVFADGGSVRQPRLRPIPARSPLFASGRLGDVTRIAIEVSSDFTFKYNQLSNPERLFFDIHGARPDLTTAPQRRPYHRGGRCAGEADSRGGNAAGRDPRRAGSGAGRVGHHLAAFESQPADDRIAVEGSAAAARAAECHGRQRSDGVRRSGRSSDSDPVAAQPILRKVRASRWSQPNGGRVETGTAQICAPPAQAETRRSPRR